MLIQIGKHVSTFVTFSQDMDHSQSLTISKLSISRLQLPTIGDKLEAFLIPILFFYKNKYWIIYFTLSSSSRNVLQVSQLVF